MYTAAEGVAVVCSASESVCLSGADTLSIPVAE